MPQTRIGAVLQREGSIVFPGVYDTLSAMLVERAGFPMSFISGYSVAATAIGEPDLSPAKGKRLVTARVDAALVEQLDELAKADRRSRSDLVIFALEEYVSRQFQRKQSPRKRDGKAAGG